MDGSNEEGPQGWALFSTEADRSFKGNDGYTDLLGSHYAYDSQVANWRRVRVDDWVVIRDRSQVYGVAQIDEIKRYPNFQKTMYVCPSCSRTSFDERITKTPRYRCRTSSCNALTFEETVRKDVSVTHLVAKYGRTWHALDDAITNDDLKSLYYNNSVQNAMRPIDVGGLLALLVHLHLPLAPEDRALAASHAIAGGHTERKVKARVGQPQFRAALIGLHGFWCAVTGPCPVEALEAAHLRAFAEHEEHQLSEGLLLRADIHKLFDRKELAINPDTRQVIISPNLKKYSDYRNLEGITISQAVDEAPLRAHYESVVAKWQSARASTISGDRLSR